ncbi:MAG TPA: hypothetical protein VGD53_02730 [Actinoallomurus sp.]
MLRERPALAADLLECVRSDLVPAFSQARLESGDLSEHTPAAYHADALVTFGGEQRTLAVVVEVQLRPDRRKHLSWPAYLATARARLGCPVMLLVICPEGRVAAWARRPIPLGHPGLVLTPLVLGPEEVPVLTVAEDASAPELAVVSAVVHGAGPEGAKVFATMLESFEKIEPEQARGYIDEVLAVLPETARKLLEAIMKTRDREYKSDFARGYYGQGEARGEARGEAKAVLAVLSTRGIDVPEKVRVRIWECTDLALLESWVRRAVTVASVGELFDE